MTLFLKKLQKHSSLTNAHWPHTKSSTASFRSLFHWLTCSPCCQWPRYSLQLWDWQWWRCHRARVWWSGSRADPRPPPAPTAPRHLHSQTSPLSRVKSESDQTLDSYSRTVKGPLTWVRCNNNTLLRHPLDIRDPSLSLHTSFAEPLVGGLLGVTVDPHWSLPAPARETGGTQQQAAIWKERGPGRKTHLISKILFIWHVYCSSSHTHCSKEPCWADAWAPASATQLHAAFSSVARCLNVASDPCGSVNSDTNSVTTCLPVQPSALSLAYLLYTPPRTDASPCTLGRWGGCSSGSPSPCLCPQHFSSRYRTALVVIGQITWARVLRQLTSANVSFRGSSSVSVSGEFQRESNWSYR